MSYGDSAYAIRSKEDVEFHSDSFRDARPAVNVKVSFPNSWPTLAEVVADHNGETEFGKRRWLAWFEEYMESDPNDWTFQAACEDAWDMLAGDTKDIFGKHAKVYSEGRSGGWAVVEGIPPFESWDAMDLSRWRRFAKLARAYADDVPYQMVSLVYLNMYEAEVERLEWHERHGC